jgi:hypothetical protein
MPTYLLGFFKAVPESLAGKEGRIPRLTHTPPTGPAAEAETRPSLGRRKATAFQGGRFGHGVRIPHALHQAAATLRDWPKHYCGWTVGVLSRAHPLNADPASSSEALLRGARSMSVSERGSQK